MCVCEKYNVFVFFSQTTILIDWLIQTSCYSEEIGQNYSKKKVESVQDKQKVTASLRRCLITNLGCVPNKEDLLM